MKALESVRLPLEDMQNCNKGQQHVPHLLGLPKNEMPKSEVRVVRPLQFFSPSLSNYPSWNQNVAQNKLPYDVWVWIQEREGGNIAYTWRGAPWLCTHPTMYVSMTTYRNKSCVQIGEVYMKLPQMSQLSLTMLKKGYEHTKSGLKMTVHSP